MEEKVIGLKCKNCSADLKYNPKAGLWICDYCGSKFTEKEFEENKKVVDKEKTDKKDTYKYDEYNCPNCGATVITDGNTTATECVYCGSSTILKNRLQGEFKPDKMIVFKSSKGEAVQIFKNFVNKRWFSPDEFSNEENIKKVQGVYVPFWLFDYKTEGAIRAKTTNSSSYRRGDYMITDTRHYDCVREGELEFVDIPVDGSSKFLDDIMDSIEPYNYSDFKEFNYSFLSGFLAEKFDMSSENVDERAKIRAENTTYDKLDDSLRRYSTVSITSKNINIIENAKPEYALLPVWLLNIKYNDKMHTFAMNGQTGKMIGNVPIDKKKACRFFIGLSILIFAVSFLITSIFFSSNDYNSNIQYSDYDAYTASLAASGTPKVDETEKVYDFAELFTDEEEENLYKKICKYINKYDMDMAIVTIAENNKMFAANYADDFWDYNDFGVGEDKDGILFLIDMDTREAYISTTGKAIGVYKDSYIDRMLDKILEKSPLDSPEWCADKFIDVANHYAGTKSRVNLIVITIISLGIPAIVTAIQCSKHRTIKKGLTGEAYIKKESFRLTKVEDRYLTTTTSRVRISSDSGSSSGGGSSIHRSSSGRSHGGGGRRF